MQILMRVVTILKILVDKDALLEKHTYIKYKSDCHWETLEISKSFS